MQFEQVDTVSCENDAWDLSHCRSTRNVSRFTILLNNMRLMGILDWWMEVLDFIYTSPENPFIQS